jgi:hypothetical protein
MNWIWLAAMVVFLAWISANYHRRRGYYFWRTFIMAIMGFGGLGLLFYKLFVL